MMSKLDIFPAMRRNSQGSSNGNGAEGRSDAEVRMVRFTSAFQSRTGRNLEPVYDRLKARLLREAPAPSQLLQIGILADELGTSSTPVREALIRLAAEKLIAYVPKKGFLAKTPSQAELQGLYVVTRSLLISAIRSWSESGTLQADPSPGAERKPLRRLNGEATDLPHATADLFLEIASHSGIEEIAAIVSNANDRLHHARLAERLVIGGASRELEVMRTLHAERRCEELYEAIRRYHDLRLRLLPSIYKELLLIPFASPSAR